MNNDRRKALEEIRSKLDELASDLGTLRDEEQEYYDNMPENMQSGEKGDVAQQAISEMEDAITDMESAADKIGNATGS